MTIFLDKKRKSFGTDVEFIDFIDLLKSNNILLNFDNETIILGLKKCFEYYCSSEGKINKQTLFRDIIKKLSFIKHSHNSREGLKERGFDDDYIDKHIREGNKVCVEHWIKKGYSKDEAEKIISKIQSERGKKIKGKSKIISKEYIESLGIDSKSFFRKRSVWCTEYWVNKGYTDKEAKEKITELQKELANRNASKSKSEHRKNSVRCIEYWISKGYSDKEAKEKVSIVQSTFSLEKCIKKYGEKNGYEKWKKRQIKWQDSLNKTGFHQLGHSPISQELFREIEKHYSKEDRDFLFYETRNKEYTLKNKNGFYYRYDFCDLNKRKIIEFNGDIYHGNPNIFSPNDKPNPFHDRTAKELWEIDKDKKELAEKNGFSELIIWEKDYRENKEKIINECLKFLNYE